VFVSFVLLASTFVDGQPLIAELSTFLLTRKDSLTFADMYGVLAIASIGISMLMHTVILIYWVVRRTMFGSAVARLR
jgi:hypothetical protein